MTREGRRGEGAALGGEPIGLLLACSPLGRGDFTMENLA